MMDEYSDRKELQDISNNCKQKKSDIDVTKPKLLEVMYKVTKSLIEIG